MAVLVAVAERGVGDFGVPVDGQLPPLFEVGFGLGAELVVVAREFGNLAHGPEADDALDGEVGLVSAAVNNNNSTQKARDVHKRPGKVVGAQLVRWDQRVGKQILRPLPQQGVVILDVVNVAGPLDIGQRHDDHVAALLQWHRLIVALWVPLGDGKGAEVVLGPIVGVRAALLVLKDGVKQILAKRRVEVHENRVGGEDNVDRLDVAVGADLLEEDVGLLGRAGELEPAKRLPEGECRDKRVVGAGRVDRVDVDLVVEVVRHLGGVMVVLGEGVDRRDLVVEVVLQEAGHRLQLSAQAGKVDELPLDQSQRKDRLNLVTLDISKVVRKGKDGPALVSTSRLPRHAKNSPSLLDRPIVLLLGVVERPIRRKLAADHGIVSNLPRQLQNFISTTPSTPPNTHPSATHILIMPRGKIPNPPTRNFLLLLKLPLLGPVKPMKRHLLICPRIPLDRRRNVTTRKLYSTSATPPTAPSSRKLTSRNIHINLHRMPPSSHTQALHLDTHIRHLLALPHQIRRVHRTQKRHLHLHLARDVKRKHAARRRVLDLCLVHQREPGLAHPRVGFPVDGDEALPALDLAATTWSGGGGGLFGEEGGDVRPKPRP